MQTFDLIIVGGGLAGVSLAVALADARLDIALIDVAPLSCGMPAPDIGGETWDARVYAITPASARFLSSIGVWPQLETGRIMPVRFMEVAETSSAGKVRGRVVFDAREARLPELAFILEESLIRRELHERLKRQANLKCFAPAIPMTLETESSTGKARLTLADGAQLQAALIVGADGRDSWVRQHVGLLCRDSDYASQSVVANFMTEKPHRATAWQWFRQDGVLAFLPLPGDLMSMVWSVPNEQALRLLALTPEALAEIVSAAGNDVLGTLRTITPAQAFPLRCIRVPEIVAPRLALVGDAAHGIHPLSGHGINLGLQDTCALALLLKNAVPGEDIGDIALLRRYQRERREEITLLQTVTDKLAQRPLSAQSPGRVKGLVNPLLGLGLSCLHRLPGIKNMLARYAAGVP
jgi:ubiquinone biosynthesis UbiH/UbiF/VisC/COQ6 family hydroxylase